MNRRLIPLVRRVGLAVAALALSVICFREPIAFGLIARGDDVVQSGDPLHALRYYDRAAALVPGDSVVAERTSFAALLAGERAAETRALARVRAASFANPSNFPLRLDRARLAHAVGNERESCDAFRELGMQTADWRMSAFAAQCAKRLGRTRDAVRAFRRVLALMPRNGVARRELARLASTASSDGNRN